MGGEGGRKELEGEYGQSRDVVWGWGVQGSTRGHQCYEDVLGGEMEGESRTGKMTGAWLWNGVYKDLRRGHQCHEDVMGGEDGRRKSWRGKMTVAVVWLGNGMLGLCMDDVV